MKIWLLCFETVSSLADWPPDVESEVNAVLSVENNLNHATMQS